MGRRSPAPVHTSTGRDGCATDRGKGREKGPSFLQKTQKGWGTVKISRMRRDYCCGLAGVTGFGLGLGAAAGLVADLAAASAAGPMR
jgi:hypothetical protein